MNCGWSRIPGGSRERLTVLDCKRLQGILPCRRLHWGSEDDDRRETDTDLRKTNVGVNAIAEILADLDTAIALLPAAPGDGDKDRATSWAAKAYRLPSTGA